MLYQACHFSFCTHAYKMIKFVETNKIQNTHTSTFPEAKSSSIVFLFQGDTSAEISHTLSCLFSLSASSFSSAERVCPARALPVNTSARVQLSRAISRYNTSGFTCIVQRTSRSSSSAGVVNLPINSPSPPADSKHIHCFISKRSFFSGKEPLTSTQLDKKCLSTST